MNRYEVEVITMKQEVRRTYAEYSSACRAFHNAKYQNPEGGVRLRDLEQGTVVADSARPYRVVVDYDSGPHSHFRQAMDGTADLDKDGNPYVDLEHQQRFEGETEARELFAFLCCVCDIGVGISLYHGSNRIDGCILTDHE